MEESTTKELIHRLQAGDLDALGALYDRFNQMVFRTAYAIAGDSEAASDLLQEVYLRLHRFADRVDPERPLEPWLYRVTVNLSCTWVKRRRWMRPIEEIAEWFVSDSKPSPARQAEVADEWRRVERAISGLPLAQRTVIVMYYINELSIQEISDILEIPAGTIKSRLHYGRRTLKQIMTAGNRVPSEVQYEFT